MTPPSKLLATSAFKVLVAEGFDGSYPSVARCVRALGGPRFRPAAAASVPIETAPGEECQFDWSDCSSFTRSSRQAVSFLQRWLFGADREHPEGRHRRVSGVAVVNGLHAWEPEQADVAMYDNPHAARPAPGE